MVYNDLNSGVVGFWRVLRCRSPELLPLIQATPWARQEYELAWEPWKPLGDSICGAG